jgi:hypothetical protein
MFGVPSHHSYDLAVIVQREQARRLAHLVLIHEAKRGRAPRGNHFRSLAKLMGSALIALGQRLSDIAPETTPVGNLASPSSPKVAR